jgi:hypothetical protein
MPRVRSGRSTARTTASPESQNTRFSPSTTSDSRPISAEASTRSLNATSRSRCQAPSARFNSTTAYKDHRFERQAFLRRRQHGDEQQRRSGKRDQVAGVHAVASHSSSARSQAAARGDESIARCERTSAEQRGWTRIKGWPRMGSQVGRTPAWMDARSYRSRDAAIRSAECRSPFRRAPTSRYTFRRQATPAIAPSSSGALAPLRFPRLSACLRGSPKVSGRLLRHVDSRCEPEPTDQQQGICRRIQGQFEGH